MRYRNSWYWQTSIGITLFFLSRGLVAIGGDSVSVRSTEALMGNEQIALDLALARSSAVFSGRFEVLRSTGFRQDEKSRTSQGPYRFSLSGEDWARQALEEQNNRVVNREGQKMLLFAHPEQPDGSVTYGAQMRGPTGIRKVEGDSSPFFAGTFWSQLMLDFVKTHRDRVRLGEPSVIDGHETRVLEWEIKPGEAFEILSSVNGVTYGAEKLRVYAAPSLGYALPRIEVVGRNQVVGCRYESTGFAEASPGVWFPQKTVQQLFDPDPRWYEEYEFSAVSLVNQSIPNEDFAFSVPAGTSLADMRDPATSALIQVEKPQVQQDLEKLLAEAQRYSTSNRPSTLPVHPLNQWGDRTRVIVVLLNVSMGAILLFWLILRNRKNSVEGSENEEPKP